jgi:hypothetical protein
MAKRSLHHGKWLCLSLLLLLMSCGYLTGRNWQQARTDNELLNAIQQGNVARVQRLLSQGANPNAFEIYSDGWYKRLLPIGRWQKDVYYSPTLVEALRGESFEGGCLCCRERPTDVPIARLLLNGGAKVNSTDSFGRTPLMVAAQTGSVEGIKLLLSEGADATKKDESGESALDYAGDTEIKRLLQRAGAKE